MGILISLLPLPACITRRPSSASISHHHDHDDQRHHHDDDEGRFRWLHPKRHDPVRPYSHIDPRDQNQALRKSDEKPGTRQKLRKYRRVEGDWEFVRQGEVRGYEMKRRDGDKEKEKDNERPVDVSTNVSVGVGVGVGVRRTKGDEEMIKLFDQQSDPESPSELGIGLGLGLLQEISYDLTNTGTLTEAL
ncbi:hypothetical protein BCR39DRAFT_597276 [Naematelia encephala]|uniref:Uncharacterized protein n=1 Tax=Naematelia encephala TaxID=71784 RepID=A0A1Y2BFU1_9TREE|nr:hypothetical protein BCR39DRAFT_597276 [Naematelia encephala]